MKLKKSAVVSIVIAILFGGLSASATAGENNADAQDINALKTKIGELEKTITTQAEQIQRTEKVLDELRKQLDAQIKENDRLREICKKAGIDTTKESVSDSKSIGHIIYRGKERDADWFNRMYKMFSDKIALLNGEFVDLRTHPIKPIDESYVEVGTIVSMCRSHNTGDEALSIVWNRYYRVVSVIGDGEALINCTVESTVVANRKSETGRGDFIFHVCGYDHPLIDGQDFPYNGNLICVGTYKYTTALGAQKTVQSFKVWEPKPLTKEQFAEALRSGFELVNYVEQQGKSVKVPIR